MAYSYNINTSQKDTRSSASLFICHRLSEVISLFLSTFLIAYIHSFSGNIFSYIRNVATFEIFTYIALGIGYVAISPIVDLTNRVWIYRIGLFLRGALVMFAIFFGKDLSKLLIVAGLLQGVSLAFYHASYNAMTQEMVSRKSMKSYVTLNHAVKQMIKIILPITMGTLIEVSTYATVAIYVAVVCGIQIFTSFFIKAKRPENSSFSFRGYFRALNERPAVKKKMKFIYISGLVYGTHTIVDSLVNICIMWELGSNFSLGMLTSLFSIVSALSILSFTKFTKSGKRSGIYWLLAFLPPIGTIIFAAKIGLVTLIIFNSAVVITRIVIQAVFEIYRNSNLKEDGFYDYIVEHQAIMDSTYNISRLTTFILMFLVGMMASLAAFKIFLCVISLSFTGMILMLLLYEKRYFPDPDKADERAYKIIMKAIKN